jgi:hypothetical protein
MNVVNVVERQSLWNVSLKKLQGCQSVGTERCLRKTVLVYNTLKVIHATFGVDCAQQGTPVQAGNGQHETSTVGESSSELVVAGQLVSDEPHEDETTKEVDIYSGNDEGEVVGGDVCNEDEELLNEERRNKETGSTVVFDAEGEGRSKRCPLIIPEGNQSKRICIVDEERKCETCEERLNEESVCLSNVRDRGLDLLSSCMKQCRLQTAGFRDGTSTTGWEEQLCFPKSETPGSADDSIISDDVDESGQCLEFTDEAVTVVFGCSNLSHCGLEVGSLASNDHSRLIQIMDN